MGRVHGGVAAQPLYDKDAAGQVALDDCDEVLVIHPTECKGISSG